ncbi:related to amino-terminal amidase [Rhynchosporium secalis]|uniref:Related to amino-terminal amidase n=1 Tax=Rhynchosporium secalis TaxID=38038 RepID=A0A1E1MT08_RHYSE|nr:related to amino-terminal amidase [Rhynchosporium secalis]
MRIGCLQFAPQVGDIDNNLNRADAVLSKANPQDLDLLVLPELAFSGYNFKSLQHISPYLEPTTAGITSLWARTTALKYDCVVTAGYPEKVDTSPKWPASPEYYNSAITVNSDGETIANYRKSFLYYADETWALEGPDGFYDGEIAGLGNVAMGICKWPTKSFERMDLNPYKFEAPWSAWEFAYHILHKQANLVIISMAWLTREDSRAFSRTPKEPDMETLSYWLARLEPLIRAEGDGEIIVVLANRCGTEDDAVYAGTSAVLGIQGGEVKVYGILGRGERELLVVDTTRPPQAKLISEPTSSKSSKPNDKKASTIPETKARSAVSAKAEKSGQSPAPGLSVNTNATAVALPSALSPPPPDAMDIITGEAPAAPLSPVDARSPSSFFAKSSHHNGVQRQKSLKSSVREPAHPQSDQTQPIRNGGIVASSVDKVKRIDPPGMDSPTFYRPPVPKSIFDSRNCQPHIVAPSSTSLNLVKKEPAKEKLTASRTFGVGVPLQITESPPYSASIIPDHDEAGLQQKDPGLASHQHSPRPRSVNW